MKSPATPPHAVSCVTYSHTCHMQLYIPHTVIHTIYSHTCHSQLQMPHIVTHATYIHRYSHTCHVQCYMPHAAIHATCSHTSCYPIHIFTGMKMATNRHYYQSIEMLICQSQSHHVVAVLSQKGFSKMKHLISEQH